jgi:hypothetical protein
MASVYKNAFSIQIYLGEPYPDTCAETGRPVADIVVEFLATFGDEMKVLSEDHPRFQQDVEKFITYREFTRKADAAAASKYREISPIIRGLRELTSRRWWQRMWAVQEASLAKQRLSFGVTDPYLMQCSHISTRSQFIPRTFQLGHHFLGTILEIICGFRNPIGAFSRRLKPPEHQLEDIINALDRARALQASDSRDRVYGILGIVDPNNSILPLPDYNQTTTHVFSLVSRRLIEASKTLEVL